MLKPAPAEIGVLRASGERTGSGTCPRSGREDGEARAQRARARGAPGLREGRGGAPRDRPGSRPELRAATHLSELEGRDDGDNDAHETDVEPIPVGQAGIGLSL